MSPSEPTESADSVIALITPVATVSISIVKSFVGVTPPQLVPGIIILFPAA